MKECSRPPRMIIAALAVALLLGMGASAAHAEGDDGPPVVCGGPIPCNPSP
jgi:hypothetical protein